MRMANDVNTHVYVNTASYTFSNEIKLNNWFGLLIVIVSIYRFTKKNNNKEHSGISYV